MGLMIEEQETHINFSRGDERAKIYTSDPHYHDEIKQAC